MTENMKKFLEAVSKNADLAAKITAMSKEALLALAKDLGIELTDDERTLWPAVRNAAAC